MTPLSQCWKHDGFVTFPSVHTKRQAHGTRPGVRSQLTSPERVWECPSDPLRLFCPSSHHHQTHCTCAPLLHLTSCVSALSLWRTGRKWTVPPVTAKAFRYSLPVIRSEGVRPPSQKEYLVIKFAASTMSYWRSGFRWSSLLLILVST